MRLRYRGIKLEGVEIISNEQFTFLNSEAHFRIAVEMGIGSVACSARTVENT